MKNPNLETLDEKIDKFMEQEENPFEYKLEYSSEIPLFDDVCIRSAGLMRDLFHNGGKMKTKIFSLNLDQQIAIHTLVAADMGYFNDKRMRD